MIARIAAAALAGIAVGAAAGATQAGNVSQLEILGFSADGSVFAFEEYGVQDGSGFPYANRFYIDTAADRFLPDTPIRVRIDDEGATEEEARRQALEAAQAIIADEELRAHPGHMAGANAITEYSADPHRIAVNPRPIFPPLDSVLEFRLEEIGVEQPRRCDGLGEVVGYRLLRIGTVDGEPTSILHQDASVPESRRCPLGYRLGGVQTFYPENGEPVFAVLIATRSFGFEGPDYYWHAVTGLIDGQ